MNDERKLVTIRTVSDLLPIEGADKIVLAKVDGWSCVVKKGEFEVGSRALYLEIDSLCPQIPQFDFLQPRGIKKMLVDGKEIIGYRLKTIKLKGQLSQGLLLPLTAFWGPESFPNENDDLAALLGVIKYEAPIPAQLSGMVRGNFPTFIRKTDQERCQNLVNEIEGMRGSRFEVTEKLDGSSMTIYLKDGEFGVCSRNMDLKDVEGNTHWRVVKMNDMEAKLRSVGRNLALQGELCGEGIQKNPYKLSGQDFFLFDVYDIDKGRYLPASERVELVARLGLRTVPVIEGSLILSQFIPGLLLMADGMSMLSQSKREGLVFKSVNFLGNEVFSFKVISNSYLLDEE